MAYTDQWAWLEYIIIWPIKLNLITCCGYVIITAHGHLQESEYEIVPEGVDHSDYLIFQYDGINDWWWLGVLSNAKMIIESKDDEFKMIVWFHAGRR